MGERERERELTDLDGSRIEAILMGSSRRRWLECIFSDKRVEDVRRLRIRSEREKKKLKVRERFWGKF